MNYIIKSAKTVEEAIEQSLSELDLDRAKVEVEVLEEGSRGFLGLIGAKDAKVKVSEIKDIEKLAKDFLGKLVSSMDLEATIDIKRQRNTLFIDIRGIDSDDKGIVIGKRGNTLDALQYLLSLFINKEEEDYIKIEIGRASCRERV